MNRIGIQILTREREDYLAMLLQGIYHQTYKSWDILILNSGPPLSSYLLLQTIKFIQNSGKEVTIYQLPTSTDDVGLLRQMILDKDNHELGLRIDDDSIIETNFIENLIKTYENETNVGAVGCLVPYIYELRQTKSIPSEWNRVSSHWDTDDDSIYLYDPNGLNLFYPAGHLRSSFLYNNVIAKKIGYNSGYPTGFREETDFTIRMGLDGYKVLICPHAIAWHYSAPTGNPNRFDSDIKWNNNILYKRRMNDAKKKTDQTNTQ